MSSIVPFNFESHQIRVTDQNGDPWFVAADVCAALELGNVSQALSRLDADEQQVIDFGTLISNEGVENQGLNQGQKINLVSESGMYSLVLGSRKPEAKRFKKWVTSEVLPQIRKTGAYQPTQAMIPSAVARHIIDDFAYVASKFGVPMSFALQLAGAEATKVTGQPWDRLLTSAACMNAVPYEDVYLEPTELGKLFGLSGILMNRKLEELGLQSKVGGQWTPTEAGSALAVRHAWVRGSKSGYNLKWNAGEIEKLMELED